MKKLLVVIILLLTFNAFSIEIPTPESFFGFVPGSDRNLFTYEQLIGYLQKLDTVSDRMHLIEEGQSPMGKPMYILFISDENNIFKLEDLKTINKELAINPYIPKNKKNEMIENGKVFFLNTLSMHSNEVGPSQALPLFAYKMATTENPEVMEQLNNVVLMFIPCHNPDGMDMVVNHYNKYKGTKYEGSSLPGVYHKYVGHDNNRDFISLTQSDTQTISKIVGTEWYPQILLEKHQMGSTGPRYFVPPNHDPLAENIDENMWMWLQTFGTNAAKDMTAQGLKGVSHNWMFDNYWPGSTETSLWKNVISWLTECASVKYATPIFIEKNELRVGGKGLSEYEKSSNMPALWEGGWWKLSDIVKYELASLDSALKTASNNRSEILKFRNDMCVKNVIKGETEPPYFYILPKNQNDISELNHLVILLNKHGVDVFELTEDVVFNNFNYQKGSVVIPLAQAYRPFIKEVMEKQVFPERHYTPNGKLIKPYDITSWSLPLHYGLKCFEVKDKLPITENQLVKIDFLADIFIDCKAEKNIGYILSSSLNSSYKTVFSLLKSGINVERCGKGFKVNDITFPAGSFYIPNSSALTKQKDLLLNTPFCLQVNTKPDQSFTKLQALKIALVETDFHDMDAGWTRYVFDSYNIQYTVLKPKDFTKIDLAKNFHTIIFPDKSKSVLMKGKYKSGSDYFAPSYPPSFIKGIGEKGFSNLMTFIDKGGIVVAWRNSISLFEGLLKIKRGEKDFEEFSLPFRNISKQLKNQKLYVPGSFVTVKLLTNHPITYGLPEDIGVFSRGTPAFSTRIPNFDMDRRVIGYYPKNNILLSGYSENIKSLSNKSAIIWMKKGKGQFILFAFNPQFRASTPVTYKLLFNSILINKLK